MLFTLGIQNFNSDANFYFIQAKDERIHALETENAMLYLKLAQLRGVIQKNNEDASKLNSQYEGEQKFRKSVAETACKLKRELDVSLLYPHK